MAASIQAEGGSGAVNGGGGSGGGIFLHAFSVNLDTNSTILARGGNGPGGGGGGHIVICTNSSGQLTDNTTQGAINVNGGGSDGSVGVIEINCTGTDVGQSSNAPPIADAGGPYEAFEGDTIQLDGSGSSDPDQDPLSFEWQFDGQTFFDVSADVGKADDFFGTATLTVDDGQGGTDVVTTTVAFLNAPPAVDAGPDQTVDDGDTVSLAATFTDAGVLDTHTATIDWGDGTVEAGTVAETNGSGTVAGTHVFDIDCSRQYAGTEFFTVTVTVTDKDGGVGSDSLIVEVNCPPITANSAGPYVQPNRSEPVSSLIRGATTRLAVVEPRVLDTKITSS